MASLSRRMKIALSTLMTGLIIAAIASYFSMVRTNELLTVYSQKEKIEVLYNNVQGAERAQRGYLLTNDVQYLKPFEKYEHELVTYSDDKLSRLVFHKYEEMKRTVILMQKGRRDEAIDIVKTDEGLHFMRMIEAEKDLTLKELRVQELQLLRSSNRWKNGAVFSSCGISALSSVILWVALYRYKKGMSL